MPIAKISRAHNFVDSAAEGAEHAIRSTQDAANHALEQLAGSVNDLRDRGSPALERAKSQAADYAHELSQRLRDQALYASDTTRGYIRDEPVKAVLIAAATGALLMALANLFRHTSTPRRPR